MSDSIETVVVICSQDYTEDEVIKDLWRSPSPSPLLQQGHSEPVAPDHVEITRISVRMVTAQYSWANCASAWSLSH